MRNTLLDPIIIDQPSANPRLETQTKNGNIQETGEDNHQVHKIYHFHNCGVVYLDSHNTRNIAMEHCGNNVPQIAYHLRTIGSKKNDKNRESQPHAVSSGPLVTSMDPFPHTARVQISFFNFLLLVAISCLAYYVMSLPRLCSGERM